MFKTYNASAGSGKTTNLVAEYLSICLKAPESYRSVLAVTFTNNATAEMKGRIIQTLNDFAFTAPDVWDFWEEQDDGTRKRLAKARFIHQTTQTLSQLDSVTIQDRSEKLLENILSHYPDFAISTIDSFFQRIVRSFAFDLGLNIDFNVEVSLDDYFQQTVDLLYQRISGKKKEGKKLARRVLDLMEQKMEEKGHWRIDDDLLALLKNIYYNEQAQENIDLLKDTDFQEASALLSETWEKGKEKLENLVNQAREVIRNSGIKETDFPSNGIIDWLDHVSTDSYKTYVKTEDAVNGASFTKARRPDLSPQDRETIIRIKREIETLIDETLRTCKIVRSNFKKIHLIFDLQRIMEELRLQDNKFFLSETGQLIQKEIKGNPVPYIYSKVGSRFRNYFIDEFQDTSDTQWENMLPLLDEAVASGGKAILFGDVKQAIYRFRNGNPQLFADLVRPGSERRRHFERLTACEEQHLDTNHRTLKKIIDFNNRFFTEIRTLPAFPQRLLEFRNDFYRDFYASVEQKMFKTGEGFVAIQFRPEDNETADINNYLAEATLKAVKDALNRNYSLHDIAVLTRTTTAGEHIGKVLSDNGCPVISVDSLTLGSSEQIRLLIAMMRYIASPSDNIARLQLFHLLLNRDNRNEELADYMERLGLEGYNSLLNREFSITVCRNQWQTLPLISLVHSLIQALKIPKKNCYTVEFINQVHDFGNNQGNNLSAFLEWWEDKGCRKAVSMPDDIDAVRIMTIHKSKGKEFPVVIMPVPNKYMKDLTKANEWRTLDPSKFGLPTILYRKSDNTDAAFSTENFAEEKALTALDEANILYVGHTRPEEALYIIADKTRPSDKDKNSKAHSMYFSYSLLLEDFIQQHPDEFTEKDGYLWFGDMNHTSSKPHHNTGSEKSNEEIPISDFSLSELLPADTDTEKQEIGIAIHTYFEKLEHFPMTEAEADQWHFDEGQLYQDEIRAALKSLTRKTDILPYFADGMTVLKEVTILTENGERRRPDRVVQLDNETLVIDFKTGHPAESARKKHLSQVQEYVELLQSMGFPNVRGELLYF